MTHVANIGIFILALIGQCEKFNAATQIYRDPF